MGKNIILRTIIIALIIVIAIVGWIFIIKNKDSGINSIFSKASGDKSK